VGGGGQEVFLTDKNTVRRVSRPSPDREKRLRGIVVVGTKKGASSNKRGGHHRSTEGKPGHLYIRKFQVASSSRNAHPREKSTECGRGKGKGLLCRAGGPCLWADRFFRRLRRSGCRSLRVKRPEGKNVQWQPSSWRKGVIDGKKTIRTPHAGREKSVLTVGAPTRCGKEGGIGRPQKGFKWGAKESAEKRLSVRPGT